MGKINLKGIDIKKIQYISLMIYIISMSAFQLETAFNKIIVIGSFCVFVFSSIIMKQKIKINEEIIWILLFWSYFYASMIWCNNRTDLLMLIKPSIQVIFLSLCLPNIVENKEDIEKIIKYIIISMFITAILILIRTPKSYFGIARIGGATGLNVNTTGIRMSTGALFCLYFLHKKDFSVKKKIFYLVSIILFIIVGFLTGSKKAVIILFLGIVLYEIYLSKGIKFIFNICKLLVIVVILYNILMSNAYFQNVIGRRMNKFIETISGAAETDKSYIERKYFIEQAKHLFSEYPIFGYGGNNFMSYMRNIGYHHVAYCHNNFFELLSTLGIFGFIIYYYMWIKTIYNLFRNYIKNRSNLFLIFLVITAINLILDYGHVCYHSDFNILLLVVAYLLTTKKLNDEENLLVK